MRILQSGKMGIRIRNILCGETQTSFFGLPLSNTRRALTLYNESKLRIQNSSYSQETPTSYIHYREVDKARKIYKCRIPCLVAALSSIVELFLCLCNGVLYRRRMLGLCLWQCPIPHGLLRHLQSLVLVLLPKLLVELGLKPPES